MAKRPSFNGGVLIESKPKKTRQGSGKHTKYAATSRNKARKRSRGQGWFLYPVIQSLSFEAKEEGEIQNEGNWRAYPELDLQNIKIKTRIG